MKKILIKDRILALLAALLLFVFARGVFMLFALMALAVIISFDLANLNINRKANQKINNKINRELNKEASRKQRKSLHKARIKKYSRNKERIFDFIEYAILCTGVVYCVVQMAPGKRLPFLGLCFAIALPLGVYNFIVFKRVSLIQEVYDRRPRKHKK